MELKKNFLPPYCTVGYLKNEFTATIRFLKTTVIETTTPRRYQSVNDNLTRVFGSLQNSTLLHYGDIIAGNPGRLPALSDAGAARLSANFTFSKPMLFVASGSDDRIRENDQR